MATTGLPPRDALQRVIDGLQVLIREHLALARVEAKEDLRNMAKDPVVSVAGVPPLFVGYLLLMMAAAYGLATVLPAWGAFAIVAALNLLIGGMLTFVWGGRVAKNRVELHQTGEELQNGKQWIAGLAAATAPGRADAPVKPTAELSPQRPVAAPVLAPPARTAEGLARAGVDLAPRPQGSVAVTPRADGAAAAPAKPLLANRQH